MKVWVTDLSCSQCFEFGFIRDYFTQTGVCSVVCLDMQIKCVIPGEE